MKITFLGGVDEVTGSKTLVEYNGTRILVDCGLFQGDKNARQRNWDPFVVDPTTIDAMVLTHAHIDHTGYIPLLVKNGFSGPIYCSKPTKELAKILLIDSGFLQEEDAKKANKYGYSRHRPALPLYTVKDAEKSLSFFQEVDYNVSITIGPLNVELIMSGHILGSSFVVVSDGKKTIIFSGDLGRPNQLVMKDPPPIAETDFLVVEGTYGDRLHARGDPVQKLGKIINRSVVKKGVVVIPAFAVGRTQTILYCLYQLKQQNIIADIPVFLDSPMAISVTDLFCTFKDEHKLPADRCGDIFEVAMYMRTVKESKEIDTYKGPMIIIAGSGMANGGRVRDHLKHFISDKKNTVVFTGFQAKGTTGRYLLGKPEKIKLYGKWYPVHAKIETIEVFSAHADYNETLDWLGNFKKSPEKVFINHGESDAECLLKKKIEKRFGWSVIIPNYLDSFDLE